MKSSASAVLRRWREGRHPTQPKRCGGHGSAGRSVSKILNETIPTLFYTSSQLQCSDTGCTDVGFCFLLVAVSCGRKRSCCAPGVICFSALRRSTVSPHKRLIANLSNHQQATASTSALPLWRIKAQYLEELDTNCVLGWTNSRGERTTVAMAKKN